MNADLPSRLRDASHRWFNKPDLMWEAATHIEFLTEQLNNALVHARGKCTRQECVRWRDHDGPCARSLRPSTTMRSG